MAHLRPIGACAVVCVGLSGASLAPVSARTTTAGLPTLRLDYNVGVTGWNTTLDPANTAFTNDADTELLMNAGLVRTLPPTKTNGPSRVALDLADGLKVNEDRTVYTFHIRNNAKFANGDPVTAQDVVFSITRAANRDVDPQEAATYDNLIQGLTAYNAGHAHRISGLKAINSKTLQVTITRPAAYFLAAFAYSSNFVLDRKVMSRHKVGDLTTTCTLNVGPGPFTPVCQNRTSHVTSFYRAGSTPTLTLVPNKYYYGPRPKLRLQLPIFSAQTGYDLYRAGSLDTFESVPFSEVPSWKGKKDYYQWDTSIVRHIQTDLTRAPFSNIHCRLALAHAIDRSVMAQRVPHIFTNLYTVVPPGFLGYYNGKATANKPDGTPWYNLSLANKELSRCPGGINVEWPLRIANTNGIALRDALGSMLDSAGIHVTFRNITAEEDAADQTSPMSQTGSKILWSNWQQDYPDPQDYVTLLLRHGQTYAITGWNNKSFNKLVDKADVTQNRKQRGALYIQAQKIAISQAVWIPLFNAIGAALVKPYVHGLVGGSAYENLMPAEGDWSKVSINKHQG